MLSIRRRRVALLTMLLALLSARSGPVAAQTSGVLASAERAVLESLSAQADQDGSVIRRMRSKALGVVGAAAVVGGGVLMLTQKQYTDCFYDPWTGSQDCYEYRDKAPLYIGVAAMAAGGVLMWRGFGTVETPIRVDLTNRGGFRAYRSWRW